MRGFLVLLAIVASFIIVVALVRQKPVEPQQIAVITSVAPNAPLPPSAVEPKTPDAPPTTIKMPDPVLITSFKDVGRISDPGLRTFVRRKANFKSDNVLYFEWKGSPNDKMTGDLTTKEKKYTVTLYATPSLPGVQDVLHRQVFVIPAMYAYTVEMGK